MREAAAPPGRDEMRPPCGEGVFRRAYVLVAGEAFRYPWTEYPRATRALAGLAPGTSPTAAAAHTNPRSHGMHLLDTAALAGAGPGRASRRDP